MNGPKRYVENSGILLTRAERFAFAKKDGRLPLVAIVFN